MKPKNQWCGFDGVESRFFSIGFSNIFQYYLLYIEGYTNENEESLLFNMTEDIWMERRGHFFQNQILI